MDNRVNGTNMPFKLAIFNYCSVNVPLTLFSTNKLLHNMVKLPYLTITKTLVLPISQQCTD